MAFMTPVVKNRYDIYEHSATKASHEPSFHLKSLKLVSKLYRIVISGGKSAKTDKKTAETRPTSPVVPVHSVPLIQIHKVPSAPAVQPVKSVPKPLPTPKTQAISIPKVAKKPESPSQVQSSSPKTSISPPSRPIPHIRRTMRDSVTNRVYSYSVSIPDYVPEENEEDLEAEEQASASNYRFSSSAPHMSSTASSEFDYPNSSRLAAPH